MEVVGQLTGGIAHGFNKILTGISASLELMQARLAQGRVAEVDKYLTAAQSAVKRAIALTHHLLAFSRCQTLTPQPTDVKALLERNDQLDHETLPDQYLRISFLDTGSGMSPETLSKAFEPFLPPSLLVQEQVSDSPWCSALHVSRATMSITNRKDCMQLRLPASAHRRGRQRKAGLHTGRVHG